MIFRLLTILLAVAYPGTACRAEDPPPRQPNVILILADNLTNDPAESRDNAMDFPLVTSSMNRRLQQWSDDVEQDRTRPKKVGELP